MQAVTRLICPEITADGHSRFDRFTGEIFPTYAVATGTENVMVLRFRLIGRVVDAGDTHCRIALLIG